MIYVMSGGKAESLDEEMSIQEAVITDLDEAIEVFLASEPEVDNGLPKFTYSGNYALLDDGETEDGTKNWRIKFYDSGTLTFTKVPGTIDVFCVGGGGGQSGNNAGGGGGYTNTQLSVVVTLGTYEIVVGSGGGATVAGGQTSAFGVTANGGKSYGASTAKGGPGGSGGGGAGTGSGGSDGSDGTTSTSGHVGGAGQGTTTREFGESSGTLYSGGGGGMYGKGGAGGGADGCGEAPLGRDAMPNTGGGGGAASYGATGGAGGSGIVVIRNHREVSA